jgi:predicted acylesterase/phospholipase RssA
MSNPPFQNLESNRSEIESLPDPNNFSTLLKLVKNKNYRSVLSLGGGSTPGLCGNLALLRLLEELGIRGEFAEIWGTSAGAIAGGGWASGNNALNILNIVSELKTKEVVNVAKLELAWAFLMSRFGKPLPDGIFHGRKLKEAVQAAIKKETFEECQIPFRCIAVTDDGLNQRKVFRKGPLFPAILSSMSLPGILQPREPLEGESTGFLDGGLVEKTPLISPLSEHLRRGGKQKLLLIATHFSAETRRIPPKGFINRFLQSLYALEDTLWNYQLEEVRRTHQDNVDLIILNPRLKDGQHFDFTRTQEHYLLARAIFKENLQNAGLGLTFGQS